ncbi:PAS domain S-box protein [Rubrivirga sp. IMCC45206]|uniref:PAS domain S-box protein n=1 Tax=Rubrivirga sp. IMCC45206 TaxID=3391614 RepID=UPI00398FEE80
MPAPSHRRPSASALPPVRRRAPAPAASGGAFFVPDEPLRRLLENASDLIQVVSPTAGILYSSPSVERLLGYTPAELLGRSTLAYIHPDDRAPIQREIEALLAEPGATRTATYRVRHADGRWRVLEARGRTLSPAGPDEDLVVHAHDVTERVDAEAALRASEEHFRRLIENASDMIQIVDAHAQIVYTGPSVHRLLGYTPEEIAGQPALGFLHPDDVPQATASLGTLAAAPGTSLTIGYRVRHKDGRWRHFEANCRTLAPDGADEGFVVNARDMTERVEAEAALRRAQDRIVQQETLAGLGRMAAGIAHELMNPLNFVTNFADLSVELADDLRTRLAGPDADGLLDDLAANARAIAAHGRRADAIVRRMLAHASAPGARQRAPVNGVVTDYATLAASTWRAEHPDREVAIELALDASAGEVEGDLRSIGRAVASVVTNAFDAAAAPGRVGAQVTVRTAGAEGQVEVVVEDTGLGVSEAVRARLFEPFFTTKAPGSGHVGLGLSLAHDVVVRGHGGRIDVSRAVGGGAAFTLALPTATRQARRRGSGP